MQRKSIQLVMERVNRRGRLYVIIIQISKAIAIERSSRVQYKQVLPKRKQKMQGPVPEHSPGHFPDKMHIGARTQ
jgi:hypothetical protein